MYKVLALTVCAVVIVGVLAKPQAKKYTTKYDNINLEEILANDRLLNNYYNCLMEEGKCTPDGSELKKLLPDALENGCKSCSEKQKEGSEVIIKHLIDNKPEMWTALEKKYDPSGSYKSKYAKEAQKHGVVLE
uniref:Ejaculatory bulb-specific protein 3 n=1 Tax=Cacopsylla melanoneura TaxID=428564 RepID=A0A8D9A9E6_9HEMI